MRIGFRTAGFREWSLPDALNKLKEIGYDGVELCLENHGLRPAIFSSDRVRGVRKLVDDSGLELASVSFHGDGSPVDERLTNTLRAIELTRELGHSILVLNAERAVPEERDGQWTALVERFRTLCEGAEKHDVLLAVEPEPGLLVHGTDDFDRLKYEVASDRLRMNLDIGHCHITDDVVCTISTHPHDVVHTHFEDIASKVHEHLVPGEGDMDLSGIVETLRSVGYAGYLTIDLFRITDDPVGYATRALAAMQHLTAR